MTSVDDAVAAAVERGLAGALRPLIERLERLNDATPQPGTYSAEEAGVVLGVSDDVVRRWVRQGILPRLPHINTLLIPRRAVHDYIDAIAAGGGNGA